MSTYDYYTNDKKRKSMTTESHAKTQQLIELPRDGSKRKPKFFHNFCCENIYNSGVATSFKADKDHDAVIEERSNDDINDEENYNQDETKDELKEHGSCEVCGKKTQNCCPCNQVFYCSDEHQAEHWKVHKKHHKRAMKEQKRVCFP